MTPSQPAPPTWVRKRDGRTVPFEADRISRALFAAGESCGRPDAFLARELADAVVHLLADESDGKVPTTEQVREVVDVVRAARDGRAEVARRNIPVLDSVDPEEQRPVQRLAKVFMRHQRPRS